MNNSLLWACLWVLAATAIAFLPRRRQYVPGVALLIAAPVLLVIIGVQHGFWVGALCSLGFLSMFRNPLIYFARKAMGKPVSGPTDPAKDEARP